METVKEIHERMLESIDDEFDKNVGSFIYDVTKPAAIEFRNKQSEIEIVQSKLDVENLSGEELERFIYSRTGLVRKHATKATTTVIISGSVGSTIKKGDLVSADTINFLSTEDKSIDESGIMSVFVECEQFGSIGNVPAGAINRFPISLSGLVDVYNPESITNGYDAEPDADLKRRYYNKLQRPAKAGNKYHYEQWAMEVVGVGDVKVFPKYNGPLTMKVVIIDSNKHPANADLIQEVHDHIAIEMPFGVEDLLIISAAALPINLSLNLTVANGYTEIDVINKIKENITEYLKKNAFIHSYVSYAQIGSLVINSEGVLDYTDLLVNSSTDNISIGEEEVAIMGGVNE